MCKAIERGIEITGVYLVKKSGGQSGLYLRPGKRVKK
jgi:molybdenum cofactor biosynthesis enzyme